MSALSLRPPGPWMFVQWDESASKTVMVARGRRIECSRLLRDPQMALLRGFASRAEAEHVIEVAKPHLHPSRVVSYAKTGDAGVMSAARTSESCKVVAAADVVVRRLVQRAAYLTGLSPQHSEAVQVVHYRPGAEYRAHHDWFSPENERFADKTDVAGNRLVSFFVYLADCEAGGCTAFPLLKRTFHPHVGNAVCWYNLDRAGTRDARTLHAGEPVLAGEKWGMNIWLRERAKPVSTLTPPPSSSSAGQPSTAAAPQESDRPTGGAHAATAARCAACGDVDTPIGLCLCSSRYEQGGGAVSSAVAQAVATAARRHRVAA